MEQEDERDDRFLYNIERSPEFPSTTILGKIIDNEVLISLYINHGHDISPDVALFLFRMFAEANVLYMYIPCAVAPTRTRDIGAPFKS